MTPGIVGKFLYYDRSVDPTMFMALNSMVAVKTKPTTETTKKTNQLLNYITNHPDAVIENRALKT